MARRNARDRVFADHDHTDTTTPGDYPAMGDDEASVDNLSRHPDTLAFYRHHTSAPPDVSPRVGRRRQVEISATSGADLDTKVANLLTNAVTAAERHLTPAESIEHPSTHPSVRPMLRHLFGTNLPGRDRA